MQACEEAESEGEWEPYELESHCDADESSPGSNRTNNKQKAAGPRKVENEEIVKARIRKAAAQKAKDFMESKQFTHADGHSKQVQKHPNKDTQEVPAKELQKKQQKKAVDAKKITGSKEDKSNRTTEASDLLILFLCSQFPWSLQIDVWHDWIHKKFLLSHFPESLRSTCDLSIFESA